MSDTHLIDVLRGKRSELVTKIGLPKKQAAVVEMLLFAGFVSHDAFRDSLFSRGGSRSLDVHICNIRKKLTPLGVEIKSHKGSGFEMPEASREKLKELMAA